MHDPTNDNEHHEHKNDIMNTMKHVKNRATRAKSKEAAGSGKLTRKWVNGVFKSGRFPGRKSSILGVETALTRPKTNEK